MLIPWFTIVLNALKTMLLPRTWDKANLPSLASSFRCLRYDV